MYVERNNAFCSIAKSATTRTAQMQWEGIADVVLI